jgi:FixJ family two-component response regulator
MEPNSDAVVYIVDDDDGGRASLQYLIESIGLKTQSFANPSAFLAQFDAEAIGCIVLDMRLPGASGLELLRELKQRTAEMPVIMISAYANVQDAVKATKSGAYDFFEKPLNDQGILDCVQQSIVDHRAIRVVEKKRGEIQTCFASLTEREREVLDLMIEGERNKEIAQLMRISTKTVEAYRASMMKKMQTPSVAQLVTLSQAG